MASADLREELNCSICLSIYTDPVMLSCGHNFCQGCIGDVLDTQEGSEVYTCPECRAEYQERPAPQRNLKLRNIVERFLYTLPEQEETDVFCTYCVQCPVLAAKTCLQCEASLCNLHLLVHSKNVEHILIKPTTYIENVKCTIYKEILKYYCTEDATCICVSCYLAGDHRGHKVEPLNEAALKKKDKLKTILEKLTSKMEESEKKVQFLEKNRKEMQQKAASVTERVTGLFRDLREELEALETLLLSEITKQQEQICLQVSELIQQLEIQKDELIKEMRLIEEMYTMTDPITVLMKTSYEEEKECQRKRQYDMAGDDTIIEPLDEGFISITVHRGLLNWSDMLYKIREKRGFKMGNTSLILLDVNTSGNQIAVSDDKKTASGCSTNHQKAKNPDRFTSQQVLSICKITSGQHYWEVKVSRSGNWTLGVSYPSMQRKYKGTNKQLIGYNDKSWGLFRSGKNLTALHNGNMKMVVPDCKVRTFGIYLDYEAGRLSFYQLCDPIRHLHTFTATFTEPLHAAFFIDTNDWISLKV
ncbi:LOW QUALITY PROTEIN: E3 ubiquitin/ISG15 ligase TRIM25-like [Discoglossus pictus]